MLYASNYRWELPVIKLEMSLFFEGENSNDKGLLDIYVDVSR